PERPAEAWTESSSLTSPAAESAASAGVGRTAESGRPRRAIESRSEGAESLREIGGGARGGEQNRFCRGFSRGHPLPRRLRRTTASRVSVPPSSPPASPI